ncbi:WD40 repeat-like protein [Rhizodiscina lignyota]|uniref:Pre-rRNA-processing protein IPI3 n=1 Tax=Rhizodiscina lignyota TaxID=1504668 RepID=A0A9P4IV71_9PEZI|nr:WD40 repeat-like protein [Rhizodiscina lignyota]
MLTESFVASCGLPSTAKSSKNSTSALRDVSIAIHTLHPLPAPRQTFKKSATAQNCVAVSDEHIFAAQSDKAVVNVYSRERGNQEAIVPLQEKVTSLAVAAEGTVVVMGTEGGRVMLWETCTGRFISTPPSHLQPVTCIAVSPTSSYLLTGSADSTIHVWSLPTLLSFSAPSSYASPDKRDHKSPVHTFTSHRAPIMALTISAISGPGALAVSASEDGTAIAWDYARGQPLRTFLLSAVPRALVLDPADRGFFVGYTDGTIQLIDFFNLPDAQRHSENAVNPLFAEGASATPIQPPESERWRCPEQQGSPAGAVLSLALSWDTVTLLSGHEGGQVMAWDVGGRKWKNMTVAMIGPVTNLQMLEVAGLPDQGRKRKRRLRVEKVVKPRFDDVGGKVQGRSGQIPGNYTIQAQLVGDLSCDMSFDDKSKRPALFDDAFNCPTGFPVHILEGGIAELRAWRTQGQTNPAASEKEGPEEDFVALDNESEKGKGKKKAQDTPNMTIEQQNEALRKKVEALQRVQRVTFRQLDDLRAEREKYLARTIEQSEKGTLENTDQSAEESMDVDGDDENSEAQGQLVAGAEDLVEEMEQEDAEEEEANSSALYA